MSDELIFAEVSAAIEGLFFKNVTAEQKFGANRFWKWVSTKDIANRLGWTTAKTRYWLKKLEAAGELECKRSANWCNWAQKYIHGFRQCRYKDYYEREV